MNIIIYSALINNYDEFREPKFVDKNVQYILFTDNQSIKSDIWNIKYIDDYKHINEDPQRVARYFKLKPNKVLPDHDISLWVDHKYEICIKDVEQFVKNNLINDIACFKHNNGNRDCIYQEAKVCTDSKLDDIVTIQKQIDKYRRIQFPEHFGLCDTAIMIRRNNQNAENFNTQWLFEIQHGSKRDQLSQMFVSWLLNIQVDLIKFGGDVSYRSQFFIKHPHIRK